MTDIVLAVPGALSIRTGGYLYDSRVLAELAGRRRTASALSLPARFPQAGEDDMEEAFRRLRSVPPEAALFVDGLAFGVFPEDRILALGRPVAALVHHPLALETGLAPDLAARFEASERAALALAASVVATSATTAETLRTRFGVPAEKLHVAEPGVEPAARAAGSGGGPTVVLTVATVTPRKNHIALAAALEQLLDIDWRWRIVGSLDRDLAAVARLRAAVAAGGVADRITFVGEASIAALEEEYAGADLFALPSHYEGFGMAYAEALARGLPVVAGAGGASAATVPAAAGAIVAPDDVAALAVALRRLIGDPEARRAASDAAWTHGRTLPGWSHAADVFERVAKGLT